ncbi:hypothetical protein ABH991_003610 [Bradyrhizobium ottawaense]|uniref:Uncharacterized protein n=1 Tax=Bradyrhizobium ottawaense TaxID=931866 RepID=A0ABV4G622_9BRAD
MDSRIEPLTPALSARAKLVAPRENGESKKSYAPAAFFAITLR